jgi:NADH:ubiquinone oxidoreductase subunit 5 (subunit L)/multisubunit Na+/H+ antiporter MnhA subunit
MSDVDLALWGLVLLPALVGAGLALGRADRVAVPVSWATALLTTGLACLVAWTRPSVAVPFVAGSDLGMRVDLLAALVVPTVAVVTTLALVASAAEIERARGRFHGLMLVFASSAMLTATATTLPTLLLAWEVMGATSYALIGFWWRDEVRVSAGLTAFVTTRTADLGLYLAPGAALAGGAGLALGDLAEAAPGWRDAAVAGILVAALGKAAQLPFSFWLSRAMEGPSPVSALLHSAAMVAMGGFLLLRAAPALEATTWAGPITAWLGGATALLLGVVAVAQTDLKQLLAASTSAQLGFVVMAAGVGAVSGGAAHLVAHAATKALLFLAAGAWLSLLGTKSLDRLRGAAGRWPAAGVSATVGLLSLAGVVPLSLWATKDAVLAGALHQSVWLYATGLAAAALSAAYAGKVLWLLWGRGPRVDGSEHGERPPRIRAERAPSLSEQLPLVVLAVGAACLGILALPPIAGVLGEALDPVAIPEPSAGEMGVSTGLALVVVAVAARWRFPQPRWAAGWLGLERAAHGLVVRPVVALAAMLARFDDAVLDRSVERTAVVTMAVARCGARADDRWVDGLVEQVGAQLRRLGRLARRPQTGQLYQYYLQAVLALTIAVVLLVSVR